MYVCVCACICVHMYTYTHTHLGNDHEATLAIYKTYFKTYTLK